MALKGNPSEFAWECDEKSHKLANATLLRCHPPTSAQTVTSTVANTLTIHKRCSQTWKVFKFSSIFSHLCCATAGVFFNTNAALGAIIIYHRAKKVRRGNATEERKEGEKEREEALCVISLDGASALKSEAW